MRKGLLGLEEIGGCCVSIPEMAVTLTWTVNTLESFQFKGDATHLFNSDAIKDGPGTSRVVGIILTLPHYSDLAFLN